MARRGMFIRAAIVTFFAGAVAHAQVQAPGGSAGTSTEAPAQYLAPAELENLLAPIALYPDPLLSEVLVASTYPLEIVEAQQFLEGNGNLQGSALMDAAKRENWDPSVQALVAFPDAVALLGRDVQWTTALGNAFLAQQGDVMNAIQDLRARAQNNGRLTNTAQQLVTTQAQEGQTAIAIQPANPQVMYVPSYNPQYVWGAPSQGYYPQLGYPDVASGFGFGDAVNLLSLFAGIGSGLGGILTGGWGWLLSWFTHSVLLNGLFFHGLGFGGGSGYSAGYGYGGFGGHTAWVHDPGHRWGVPYPSQALANRFHGTYRQASYRPGSGFSQGHSFALSSGVGSEHGYATHSSFGERGFGTERGTSGGGWHSASAAFGVNRFDTRGGSGSSAGSTSPVRSGSTLNAGRGFEPQGGQRGFGQQGYGQQAYRQQEYSAQNFSRPDAARQNFAGERFSGQSSLNRNLASRNFSLRSGTAQNFSAQHFSQSQHFSQTKTSAPRMSASHFSAPKAPHVSGGHSSGGHSGGGHAGGGSHGGSKRH